jgi:hypothetical protein
MEQKLREEVIGRIGCHARGARMWCRGLRLRRTRSSGTPEWPQDPHDAENPLVCLGRWLRELPNWRSVIAYGRFEELHGEEAATALQMLVERLRTLKQSRTATPGHGVGVSVPPGEQSGPRQSLIYAIRLYEMTGATRGASEAAAALRGACVRGG